LGSLVVSVASTLDVDQSETPFQRLVPADSNDLFWTMWNTDDSTFRGRRILVIDSLLIHHPHATIIMLSPTLNDTRLFLPYRRRGYRVHAVNISLDRMIKWQWYLGNRSKDFLYHWNTSGTFFYSHISDYMRAIALYLYGGTYMDMDALILQPLPREEFIGFDRSGAGDGCAWCAKNTSGLYLAPGFMRFRPHRAVLRNILENTFDRQVYNESCFNCVGPKAFTEHIFRHRDVNDSELIDLKLLEPHRLYPFMWKETWPIFQEVNTDTALLLSDLMKRSYSLHFFGHMSDKHTIARGSIVDLLFDRLNLGDTRAKIAEHDPDIVMPRLVHLPLYVYTARKQGRFLGRDVIYLRINKTLELLNVKWTINVIVHNGTVAYKDQRTLSNLNQAEVNRVLNEFSYRPFDSTSIDRMEIQLRSSSVSVNSSLTILVFSKWVTFVSKTIGTPDRWHVVQRLAASVELFFPRSRIHIASDWGQTIDNVAFFNFTSADGIVGRTLNDTVTIHNLPDDSGLSTCRNHLVNVTSTPFFFLMDDDFTIEEDSHIDLLLETIYTYKHIDIVAGKIPEDIIAFNDFSGVFLRYNQSLELRHNVPIDQQDRALFRREHNNETDRDKGNPCRRVDFVPNVFLGRKQSFETSMWDNYFKLGEHEDFFMRFGHANRSVYTCRHIQVHHHQEPWWRKVNSSYFPRRARVHTYFRQMLIKHNLKRLITFNYTNVDLDKNNTNT
jgi:glycosyltransferase involved in cell wall biosynthesis